jgi:LuxR family maltose regulon positive regulatory protein
MRRKSSTERVAKHAHDPLTDREWLVLQFIAEGLSNQEIAQRLTLSITTVKWYVKQIFNKLGVYRRTQAVQIARKLNLIE